ncbi:MAG: hypothetical protein K2W82_00700 [Candidatus Obscuribacterales bacterium]|nr:hypothetical protein [Candidatus Obscuribacterales bacterium]
MVEPKPERFERARWKHYIRFFFVGIMLVLFGGLLLQSYDLHVNYHRGFNPKEVFIYVWATIIFLPFLPTLIFEIDKVETNEQGLELDNLIWHSHENWSDLTSLKTPIYLKFAILKGKRGFYLLNKRDLPDFGKLIDSINHRAINIMK